MDTRLFSILDNAEDKTILCVGDVMLDRFVYGAVDRISPESPVPVLRKSSVSEMPGGAGNVARNMASMGLNVIVIGCVGEDEDGAHLRAALANETRIDARLAQSSTLRTIVKTRFVASNQQLLRVDTEDTNPDIGPVAAIIASAVLKAAREANAIVVSDYAKGCITPAVFNACKAAASENTIPLLVDPKSRDLTAYLGATIVKPNAQELSLATGLPCGSDPEIEAALLKVEEYLPGSQVVVTRAQKGMSWTDNGNVSHRRGEARQVYDVSGAGDTSMAAIALGIVSGGRLDEAVELAVAASGVAVGKTGTATVDAAEIRHALDHQSVEMRAPVLQGADLLGQIHAWKAAGLKVGLTNGCFDILHPGHLALLEEARSNCDRLIVAINADESVTRLKGEGRPVNSERDRALMLSALSAVDAVTVFPEDTPAALIVSVLPDLLVKGGDYTLETIIGADTVISNGGEVHIVKLVEGQSTTSILARSKP